MVRMHALDRNLSATTEEDGDLSDIDPTRRLFASLVEDLRGGDCAEEQDETRAADASPSVLQGPLSALGVGMIRVDATGRILWVSRLVEELTGWSASKLQGMPIECLFQLGERCRDDDPSAVERDARSKSDPSFATGHLLTQAGTARSVRHTIAPARDSAGW